MTDLLLLCSNVLAAGVRVQVYLYLDVRLRAAKKTDKPCAAAAFAGIAAATVLLSVSGLSDLYRIVAEAVWIAVCAGRFQAADFRMRLFVGVYYEIAVAFWQFLIGAWAGVFFHTASFLNENTRNGQMAVWLLHLLLLAAALFVSRQPELNGKEAYRFVSAMVLTGFIAVVTLSQQTMLTISADVLQMWTILAVVLLMSVLVFHINRQYEVEKELARLKTEQANLLEHDYTALNQAYAVNAKLFHDFHNHIGALRQLLSRNKWEEAIQYLDELQAPVQEMADTLWTGDETVDYLINSKLQTAKDSRIQYQIQVEFPRHTNVRGTDLCAILGNLLDNAFEAARQVQEQERFVRLTIRRINQMLVIKVENSMAVLPRKKEGVLETIKEDGLHGWGLKSAQTAAEKYDGMIQTSYTGHTFRAVATLSYQGVPVLEQE